MQTFIMLTQLAHGALNNPEELETLEKRVMDRVAGQCPEVKWVASYAILGPHDYLDVFQAPDTRTAMQVSTIVRTFGHANTEIWGATEWKRFKKMIRHLPGTAA